MKEFAKAMDLKNDPSRIEEYLEYHRAMWPEVAASFQKVGVLEMKIWRLGTHLFMVMTTTDDFDPVKSIAAYLAMHPKNNEWEELMKTYQQKLPEAQPDEHWAAMDLVFRISDFYT